MAAIVEPRAGAEVTFAALEAHCRARIAAYKVPRHVQVIKQIERHPSGKPDYVWACMAVTEALG